MMCALLEFLLAASFASPHLLLFLSCLLRKFVFTIIIIFFVFIIIFLLDGGEVERRNKIKRKRDA